MNHLVQKVNRLVASNTQPALLNEVISLFSQHLQAHSEQILFLNTSIQNSKTDTLTLLGGKISLSEFPSLLDRYSPNPTQIEMEVERVKRQVNEIQMRLNTQLEFNSIFDKGSLKEYEMRSLEDLVLGSQEYIKRSINEIIVGKADRTELQRLYALNDRFDMELTSISKGLIELSRHPIPSSKTPTLPKPQLADKITLVHQECRNFFEAVQSRIQPLQKQIEKLVLGMKEMESNVVEVESRFQAELKNQRASIEDKYLRSISSIEEQREQIEESIQQKIMISLYGSRSEQEPDLQAIREEIIELSEEIGRVKKESSQLSSLDINEMIQNHLKGIVVEESTSRQSSADRMVREEIVRLGRRIDLESKERKEGLGKEIGILKREVESKVSIKEIEKILEKLSTMDETRQIVSEAISEFQEQGYGTIRDFIDDQIVINEAMCSENMIGRWFWEGKGLRNGNLIPWQRQAINTSPQNFCWEQNTYQIIIMKEGTYRIELGVYSEEKKKPSIQLIINGNAALSAVNNSSYVIHHSSGRLKDTGCKPSGAPGITLIDFLSVPTKTRIAVSFVGESGHGFLSLKKL